MIKNAEVFARLPTHDRAIEYLRQAIALGYDAAARKAQRRIRVTEKPSRLSQPQSRPQRRRRNDEEPPMRVAVSIS